MEGLGRHTVNGIAVEVSYLLPCLLYTETRYMFKEKSELDPVWTHVDRRLPDRDKTQKEFNETNPGPLIFFLFSCGSFILKISEGAAGTTSILDDISDSGAVLF